MMVAMGKRHRLLGCFLGNLEIGYSSTSTLAACQVTLNFLPLRGLEISLSTRAVRIMVTKSIDHSSKIRNMAHQYEIRDKYVNV